MDFIQRTELSYEEKYKTFLKKNKQKILFRLEDRELKLRMDIKSYFDVSSFLSKIMIPVMILAVWFAVSVRDAGPSFLDILIALAVPFWIFFTVYSIPDDIAEFVFSRYEKKAVISECIETLRQSALGDLRRTYCHDFKKYDAVNDFFDQCKRDIMNDLCR